MENEVRRICRAVLNGDVETGNAVNRLKEWSSSNRREALSLVVSCTLFALWDLCEDGDDAGQKRLATLAQQLLQTGIMDEDVWLSTAEWDLIDASGTVASIVDDRRREVRFYTRAVYVQTRYNLFSECPTGFARLFTLCQKAGTMSVDDLRQALCRLIGETKIEPHRVADVLMEFLPSLPHPPHQIMKLFDPQKTAHLMGRKLKSETTVTVSEEIVDRHPEKLSRTTKVGRGEDLRIAREQQTTTTRIREGKKPQRYFRLCAALEVEGCLDVDIVLRYLSPTIKETQARTRSLLESMRKETHNQRNPDLNKPLPEPRTRTAEKDMDVHPVYRDPKKFSYQPLNIRDLEAEAVTHDDPILRLAAGFLETSRPGKALRILNQFEDVFCPELTDGLISVVERVIDPFYRCFPLTARSIEHFMEDVKSPLFPSLRSTAPTVFDWLVVTGYRLHLKLDLLYKVALVMLHEIRFYGHPNYAQSALLRYPAPNRHSAEYTISTVFLPSLLFMDLKQAIETAPWIDALVKMCSYSVQIMVFIHFQEVASKSAILDRCVLLAETPTRHLIKLLGKPPDTEAFENVVLPIIDALGKIALRAPYHITYAIVQKVQVDFMAAKDLSSAMLYFTPLAFDAFAHNFVLEAISTGPDRKHNDGVVSAWYRNMLMFASYVLHDQPDMVPLHFILQNILKEISMGEIIHVHVLRELVLSMGGFEHCSEIGNNQFPTLSGGPMLKSIGLVTPWQKDEVGFSASAVTLKKTLALPPRNDYRNDDSTTLKLGGQMFVLLMKFLDYVPIRGDFSNVAGIRSVHSVVLGTFLASVEFLSVYCTAQEYSEMLPPIGYVLNELKLPTHYVAHLYRPSISEMRVVQGIIKTIPSPNDPETIELLHTIAEKFKSITTSNDVDMTDASSVHSTSFLKALERSGIAQLDSSLYQKYGLRHRRSFYDFVDDLTKGVQFAEKGVWEVMSPEFYAFFWSLKLNDITISDTEYKKQMSQIQDEISRHEHENRSETTLHHLEHKLALLKTERDMQQTHVKFCRGFIQSRQRQLLSHIPIDKLRSFVDQFVQLCLYPRIRLGHEDALFAFEFVVIMTKMGVVNFPTLFILDKVVKELFPCLICMTDNEAEGFANFMYEFLKQMERWRSNTALFQKEFGSLPGALEDPYTPGSTTFVTHSNFLKVMAKWSNVIARLLKECLCPQEADEKHKEVDKKVVVDSVKHRQIMRRPALLILERLIPKFPTLMGLAKHLRAALVYVTEHDCEQGIKDLAEAALSRLDIEMESNRSGRWLGLDDYNIVPRDTEDVAQAEAPHEMTPQEINDVVQMETESKQEQQHQQQQQALPPETSQQALNLPPPVATGKEEDVDESLTQKEEGEVEKTTPRRGERRVKKFSDDAQHRPTVRKRISSKQENALTSQELPLRRSNTREDAQKKKRDNIQRSESDKEPRRPKVNRREEPGKRKAI